MKPTSWYARKYVEKFGMKLVPIQPKQKHPSGAQAKNWGKNLLDTPEAAEQFYTDNPDWNMGAELGGSRLCSLDIDCRESLNTILEEFGIPESALEGFPTIQGSAKGSRIVFRVPEGVELKYQKLTWPQKDNKRKRYTVFELRAATDQQRLDVLPPSIHPDTGEPYKWLEQPRDPWPEPPDWLTAIWDNWDKFKPQMVDACPWATKEKPKPDKVTDKAPMEGVSVIQQYIQANSLTETLERYGYQRKSKRRFLSPHSDTGLAGVVMFDDERACWVHHASDPLCSEDGGHPVNAFDLYCYYEHNGDTSEAVKQATRDLGLTGNRQNQQHRVPEAREASTATPDDPDPAPVASPFRALGYNQGRYYYLTRGAEQVEEVKRGSHTSPAEMMGLAPIEWWETAYPKQNGGVDWHTAASDLMRLCENKGIFSAERQRGRGAWYDNGSSVLHLGTRLVVDGKPKAIADHDSWYIYTRQQAMEIGMQSEPAGEEEAKEVGNIFAQLNWEKPIHAHMAAGWTVLAPICGALPWRPHVWLTAPRGAGKSWVQDHIIGPLLGAAALRVQGSTTEAGIRQAIKQDARPIVFDEAESEDHNSQRRMQTIIELARQASSETSAEIFKGTTAGDGMAFRMRSMFLLGSVNVSLSQAADESRFTVVTLEPPKGRDDELERFQQFSQYVDRTLSDSFCASIRARAYTLMPVIRENAHTLSRAVAECVDSQRIGDQVGTLLAGSWALLSSETLTLERAREWVSGMDFADAKESEEVSDEQNLLSTIMQSQVRAENADGRVVTRSLAELVQIASARTHSNELDADHANRSAARHGVCVDASGDVAISNTHAELKKVLRDTPWASGWRRILARLSGARTSKAPVWFAGSKTRAVLVPFSAIQ